MWYTVRMGCGCRKGGGRAAVAKLTVQDFQDIRVARASGESDEEIALRYDIKPGDVARIR